MKKINKIKIGIPLILIGIIILIIQSIKPINIETVIAMILAILFVTGIVLIEIHFFEPIKSKNKKLTLLFEVPLLLLLIFTVCSGICGFTFFKPFYGVTAMTFTFMSCLFGIPLIGIVVLISTIISIVFFVKSMKEKK